MSQFVVCDGCGAPLPDHRDFKGRAVVAIGGLCSDWSIERTKLHFCVREDGDDCLKRALWAVHSVCDPLEQIPVATPQKIAALRRRHAKGGA